MDLSGVIFTEAQAKEASDSLKLHLQAFFWLSAYFYERTWFSFCGDEAVTQVRPKLSHATLEVCVQ